ncbi:hypothetical protein CICLE_v10010026mg [Citrus x clementina]|uniref:Uncharacterized protein n=1 Tax=Citrus clementina TaxID=85681 RepID=V4ULE0_CITCL|nr:hypothetical protein CICLE_v10010026mg [Citrus x clementina]ESR65085.1 hypothetical protein CICLE_v10010026mg [Citrus x clementina]
MLMLNWCCLCRKEKVSTTLRAGVRSLILIQKKLHLASLLIHLENHKWRNQAQVPRGVIIKEPPIQGHWLSVLHGQRQEKTQMMPQRFQLVLTFHQF